MSKTNPETYYEKLDQLRAEIAKVVVGQSLLIERLIMAMLCRGHVLLEGVPGLAKTTTILALAKACKVDFSRIQFTPDLLPSDLIGSQIFDPAKQDFWIKKGPIFANFVLADEINRAPAKVQSALLEAMQERRVTIGEETFALDRPFLVLATQNPIEQEGTFPLPEAQVDRFFMKVCLGYPTREEELQIMDRALQIEHTEIKPVLNQKILNELPELVEAVFVDDKIRHYVTDLILATRNPVEAGLEDAESLIAFGASPRGSISLLQAAKAAAFLEHRDYVTPDDVKSVAMDVLQHRVVSTFEAEAERITSRDIVRRILDHVPVP